MPINCPIELKGLSEKEFRELDYQVMGCAFAAQNSIGNLFREEVYRKELHSRLIAAGIDVVQEVGITLIFGTFRRRYSCDLLVNQGVIYETKAVSRLLGKHQEQLLHYLFLTNLGNGKLLNFRQDSLESRFVSTRWSREERRNVLLMVEGWRNIPDVPDFLETCEALLRDWGAGLMGAVYRDALISQTRGLVTKEIIMETDSGLRHPLTFPVFPDGSIFHFSTVRKKQDSYERNIRKWFRTLKIPVIYWLNLNGAILECKTLTP